MSKIAHLLGHTLDLSSIKGRLFFDYPLSRITWMRVGGAARMVFQPENEQDLQTFLALLPVDVPVFVMGLGSNLLVRDGGFQGGVIRLIGKGLATCAQGTDMTLSVGAGMPLRQLATYAAQIGFGGLAFYCGIPGSVGGALRMNAGAHGCETQDVVVRVHAVDRHGRAHEFSKDDMGYGYRSCKISEEFIFTRALFRGYAAPPETLKKEIETILQERERTQPIREKTGGSTFKNPPGHKAWKLIDAAGCRGLSRDGACMSEKHCNFMINTGQATAHALERLGEDVRQRVYKKSGIMLTWEIKRIGNEL